MRLDQDVLPRSSYFLSSEFALGKLRKIEEIEAISEYWYRQFKALQRLQSKVSAEEREDVAAALENAAGQVWRLKRLILQRRNYDGLLINLFRQERVQRELANRFVPIEV